MTGRLPDGFVAELDARVRVRDGGAVLLGGSPRTVLRLSPAARELLRDGRVTISGDVSAALARRLLDAGAAVPRPPAGAVAPVTVVIPVRDNPDGVARLLDALARTARPREVVVVDDSSADPAALVAVASRHGARLLRHESSRGPAAARNTGLAAATTPLVACCDSDVVPRAAGWLDALCAHFADPLLAVVAPRIVALDTGGTGRLARYERVRSALDLGARPAPVRPGSAVSYVPSAVMAVRVEAVGSGFAPQLHVAEDVDLGLRLHAAGWRLRYDPAVTVAHEHRTALRPWLTRKAYYGTGAAELALRHPGQVPPLRLAPWTAAACLALPAQRWWSLPVAGVAAGVGATRLARALAGVRHRWRLAARLTAEGLGLALWQLASGLLRHWWPATALGCVVSRRVRRAVAVAAVAEAVADRARWAPREPLLPYLVAHRLDDLAYGAGLWWGAWRHRTLAPLLPVVRPRRGRPAPRP